MMRKLLASWPNVDDEEDTSDAWLAINNSLNDLLNGLGISASEAVEFVGVKRAEMERIYRKWRAARG